jgi:serine/threonine-protein kinase
LPEPLPNPAVDPRLDPRLDAVITEYLEAAETGGNTDPAQWLQRYPELANELEDFFASEARFDRLVAPLRTATPFSTPGAGATPPVQTTARTLEGYTLLTELGRGGMGVIYKARQLSLDRFVAVKMIRSAEWATPEERSRFRWEAETVAALDHPNIVPIYEVGETAAADGTRLPYFSMKLVEGENLAQAKDQFRNDWTAIARLMCLVTRAVEHAHRRGVLHRDLKPANILLGEAPADFPSEDAQRGSAVQLEGVIVTPHVSDFGLARRAQQRREGGTLPGAILGTPAYLAPELTRGHEFATSASDVYSLGAILYELLTGEPPFRADSPLEMIRLVAAGGAPAPHALNPAVPSDLEVICLTCLELDPSKRYPSADHLADDLERFLTGRPITARPVGSVTRFRRWCRRQPVIAGLSGTLLLALVIGLPLVVLGWRRAVEQERIAEQRLDETQSERDRADNALRLAQQWLDETRRERDRADEALALAHSATGDVFRLLAEDRWDEAPGTDRKLALQNGLRYYRAFVERHRADPKLRRAVAKAMFERGMIASRIGPLSEAVESYRSAVEFLRVLTREHPDETELRELQARCLVNLGNALAALNRQAEAIAAHEEAVEVWARIPKAGPAGAKAGTEQALAWMNRGVALQATSEWRRSLDSFRRGQAVLSEYGLTEKEPRLTAMLLINVAQAEDILGHRDDALRAAKEAVRVATGALKSAPRSEDVRVVNAYAARLLGHLAVTYGDLETGGAQLQIAQKELEDLRRQRPRFTEYAWNLSLVYEDLAGLAEKQKQPVEAIRLLGLAEAIDKELVDRDKESHPLRLSLARVERALGRLHMAQGNTDASRKAYEQAKVQLEYLLEHNSAKPFVRPDLASACRELVVLLGKLKKFTEAAAVGEEAVKHYRFLLDRTPTDKQIRKNLSIVLGNISIAHRATNRLPEAIRVTEERIRLWPDSPNELFDAATEFARIFDQANRPNEPATAPRADALTGTIRTLRQAVRAGLAEPEKIRTDPRFAGPRETPEFRDFLREIADPPP